MNLNFAAAPFSKTWIGCTISCSIFSISYSLFRQVLANGTPIVVSHRNVLKIVTKPFTHSDMHFIIACLLIYTFRKFERRLGTRKFASFWLLTYGMSTLMYLSLMSLWPRHFRYFPGGCYSLIGALFVYFHSDIPRLSSMRLFGVSISDKLSTYIMGAYFLSLRSFETLVLASCGFLVGIIYKSNVCGIQRFFMRIEWWSLLPQWVGDRCEAWLGATIRDRREARLLVNSRHIGATLEIQRSQEMDQLERYYNQRLAEPMPFANNHDWMPWLMGGNNQQPNQFEAAAAAPVVPSETNIARLTEMGFSRDRASAALISSGNDAEAAAIILLSDQS